jgi:hypothetical protein
MITTEAWRKTTMAIMLAGLIVQILVFAVLGLGLKFWAIPLAARCQAVLPTGLHPVSASNTCNKVMQ